ncbi:MAG: hypothetical protein NT062_13115 [Proteobacteria bacterium]|nr:hypothetical protein [Pseudomonadota bacterium]
MVGTPPVGGTGGRAWVRGRSKVDGAGGVAAAGFLFHGSCARAAFSGLSLRSLSRLGELRAASATGGGERERAAGEDVDGAVLDQVVEELAQGGVLVLAHAELVGEGRELDAGGDDTGQAVEDSASIKRGHTEFLLI